ncbi:MAG: hypothetical protein BMS9Abin25_0467 [Gammaproteobacteria bacterium]|nr:MAG: hypothetical protein BMS9Abin25_0467 [Gammaproteobacteria bacterium]
MSEKESKKAVTDTANEKETLRKNRRRALGAMAAGGAVVMGKNAPENWIKPVVDHVTLPAHAQTSAVGGTISAVMVISGDDDPDAALIYNVGSHVWTPGSQGVDDFEDADDAQFAFSAQLNPPAAVQVTMSTVADTDFDFGDLNDTQDSISDPGGNVRFSTLDSDDGPDDSSLMRMRFNAPGYQEAIITVQFNP